MLVSLSPAPRLILMYETGKHALSSTVTSIYIPLVRRLGRTERDIYPAPPALGRAYCGPAELLMPEPMEFDVLAALWWVV